MATQQILLLPGTPVSFKDSGGTVTWTPTYDTGTAAGHGRISNVYDRGAGAQAQLYRWECRVKWAATPAAKDPFRLYIVRSSASATAANTDGNLTFGDADLAAETELANNCLYIGQVLAAAADESRCSHGVIELFDRYIAIAGWNGSATKAMGTTDADLEFILTPMIPDVQASA